ncbi:hypothetical protein SLEP1_g31317 [Rubroshorea leprosula]|uniref:EXS domain-containing protein n=1 Tax=Rubroshorea leprosula TaxID=152421 RepID=A0AAV5KA99_9ROSI|nr:hypothetical protein SLEP1_g31317 [Rubroshorea leprosula]
MNHNRVDRVLAHIYLFLIMWLTLVFLLAMDSLVFSSSTNLIYARTFSMEEHGQPCIVCVWNCRFIFWVIGSSLILRCTWTYKLSAHLHHNYLTVFTITALEMCRHFQWVFFHVENEWNKMNSRSNAPPSINNLPT